MNLFGGKMKRLIISVALLTVLTGCAELLQVLKQVSIKKPTAQIVDTKITSLSFTQADLEFNVKINNPNTVDINLAGLDYQFKLDDNQFLAGNKNDALKIAANGSNNITIPLSLKYEDIYKIVTALSGKGVSKYSFEGGVSFNLPVLGNVRLPLSKSGDVPLVKIPKISLKNLKIKSLSWDSADMQLEMAVKSGGGMDLLLNNLNYNLKVSGSDWISGQVKQPIALSGAAEKVITIPFKLDFLKMGSSVYNMVLGNEKLNYSFDGSLNVSSDNPLLKNIPLNFDDISNISLLK